MSASAATDSPEKDQPTARSASEDALLKNEGEIVPQETGGSLDEKPTKYAWAVLWTMFAARAIH